MVIANDEQLFDLREIRTWLPKRRGKPPCIPTVRRWTKTGCHGVVLKTTRCGNGVFTTRGAILQFMRELSAKASGGDSGATSGIPTGPQGDRPPPATTTTVEQIKKESAQ